MKKKIITLLILIIAVVLLGFIIIKVANTGINILSKADLQDIRTELLYIQAKEKLISEQSIVDDEEDILKGEKLSEVDYESIERLKQEDILSEEEEDYDSYYVWNQEVLDELGIDIDLEQGQYYIVNYKTNEVISTNGYKALNDDKIYYRLSETKNTILEEE